MLINWFTVAAQIVNFFILVWLLKRYLYKPVLRAIDERENKIRNQLKDADQQKEQAAKERDEYRTKNLEFDRERREKMDEALKNVQQERNKMMEDARSEYQSLRSKLESSLREEQTSINREIVSLAQHEAFSLARKTLQDLATTSLEEHIVNIFILKLSSLPVEEKQKLRNTVREQKEAIFRTAFTLTDVLQERLRQGLEKIGSTDVPVRFEVKPELVSGIELTVSDFKLAWNVNDYVATLSDKMDQLLLEKSRALKVSQP